MGQNGGATVPLISPSKDESGCHNDTNNSRGGSPFTPNPTGNKSFVLMGRSSGGVVPLRSGTTVHEPKTTNNGRLKKATNSTNYTRVSTRDDEIDEQSFSENECHSDDEQTHLQSREESVHDPEVMFVAGRSSKSTSKPASSTKGGSCIVSPASSSSVGSLNANSGKKVGGSTSSSKGPPDVIKMNEELSNSLPRHPGPLQAEGLMADAQMSATRFYRHDT